MSPVKTREEADGETLGLLTGMRNFSTNRLKAARRLTGPGKFPLWPLTSYSQQHSLRISMLTRPERKTQVKFTFTPELKIHEPLFSCSCSWSWSFLKGLWGTTGGLYFPKSGYHLSLIIPVKIKKIPLKILNSTKLSLSVHGNEISLRKHDDITTFLYNIGTERSALEFEDMALIRSARNHANLVSNYDAANIARSVRASGQQREIAERIKSRGIFSNLPDKLREMLELRLNYPEETLEGLGQKANPPVSKSTVKYRWKKLESLIDTENRK